MRPEGGWHRSVVGVVRRSLEAAFDDNIPFLASALSFDLLLTLIPFIALLLAAAGYLVQHQITTQQVDLHHLLSRLLPTAPGGGEGSDEAFQGVERAVAGDTPETRRRLSRFGQQQTWHARWGQMRAVLDEEPLSR